MIGPPDRPSDEAAAPAPADLAQATTPGEGATAEARAVTPAADQPFSDEGGGQPPPPPPSAYAGMSNRAGRVVSETFQLLARSTADLRAASFHIGLIVAGTVSPVLILLWRLFVMTQDENPFVDERLMVRFGVPLSMSAVVAVLGYVAAGIESQAIAATILGARAEGRRIQLRAAVQWSRRVFWRIVGASLIVGIPVGIVQTIIETILAGLMGGSSEATSLLSSLIAVVGATPLAYAVTGVVLGDVGALEAVRRSIRLFRARKASALVVALIAYGAPILTVFGLLAGLEIIVRVADVAGLPSATGPVAVALTAALIVVVAFAMGTLVFTVTAIALAPQVVMFLALTHVNPGLVAARREAAAMFGPGASAAPAQPAVIPAATPAASSEPPATAERSSMPAVETPPTGASPAVGDALAGEPPAVGQAPQPPVPAPAAPPGQWAAPARRLRFRWLTRGMLALMVIGFLALISGLIALSSTV